MRLGLNVGYWGMGIGREDQLAPVQERIPIYLAAIGPKNAALAGEIADRWLPTLFSPEHAGSRIAQLRAVAELAA